VKREALIQREIELALGAEPDCVLLRNSVGVARNVDDEGRERFIAYGLGPGSPDLILILAPRGRLVGLEVKRPGEDATPEQRHVHAIWRRFGADVVVVHDVEEARAAVDDARRRG
jgi:dihydropteroate synthase